MNTHSTTSNEGWIEWDGGEAPVSAETKVEYRLRAAELGGCLPERAERLDWAHDDVWSDIIAYRIVEQGK